MTKLSNKMAGFSLIEVLVAFLILSVGMLGLAALQTTSVKEGFDSGQRSQVAWLLQELVERMRANPDGLQSGYTAAAANNNLCTQGPAKYCSDYNNGVGKTNASNNCSANELAEFDVWELTCGYGLNNVVSGPVDQLVLGSNALTVTCDGNPCSAGSDFTVSLEWTSTAADAATGGQSNEDPTKTIAFVVRP